MYIQVVETENNCEGGTLGETVIKNNLFGQVVFGYETKIRAQRKHSELRWKTELWTEIIFLNWNLEDEKDSNNGQIQMSGLLLTLMWSRQPPQPNLKKAADFALSSSKICQCHPLVFDFHLLTRMS